MSNVDITLRQAYTLSGVNYPVGAELSLPASTARALIVSSVAYFTPRDYFPTAPTDPFPVYATDDDLAGVDARVVSLEQNGVPAGQAATEGTIATDHATHEALSGATLRETFDNLDTTLPLLQARSEKGTLGGYAALDPATGDVLDAAGNPVTGTAGTGTDGRGIDSVTRTAGTGAPGSTDTYTIAYSDATTSTFAVYNGVDGVDGAPGTGGSGGLTPDPDNPGYYTVDSGSGITPDPDNAGFYLIGA